MFSADHTVAIARESGAVVYQRLFENDAQQRNPALAWVDTEWLFFVDADEHVQTRWLRRCAELCATMAKGVMWGHFHAITICLAG
ncbi:MAG: glycosyltransferase [Anaerolineae bacterium]